MFKLLEANHPYRVTFLFPVPAVKYYFDWSFEIEPEKSLENGISREFATIYKLPSKKIISTNTNLKSTDGSGGLGGSFEVFLNNIRISGGFVNISSILQQDIG